MPMTQEVSSYLKVIEEEKRVEAKQAKISKRLFNSPYKDKLSQTTYKSHKSIVR